MKDIDDIRRDNLALLEQEVGGPSAAAKRADMSLSQWANLRDGAKDSKTGKPRGMRKETARRIEERFGKEPRWIDADHSLSPLPDTQPHEENTQFPPQQMGEKTMARVYPLSALHGTEDDRVRFERYDIRMSAGPGAAEIDAPNVVEHIDVLKAWAHRALGSADPGRIKLVTCAGSSMAPTIADGDLLFVDVHVRHFQGDDIYCLSWNNMLLVKRLRALRNDCLEVVSDNPSGPSNYIVRPEEFDQLSICGRVIGWWGLRKN